jgi:hypothetical protein
MIAHVALYRFRVGTPEADVERFFAALREATGKAGLSGRFVYGPHIPLPADEEVPDSVYSFAATWVFHSLDELDEFSRCAAITHFEKRWARPMVRDLAIANYVLPDCGTEEVVHADA